MAVKKREEETRISQDIGGRSDPNWGKSGSGGYRALDSSGNDYAALSGMSDLDRAALQAAGSSWAAASQAGDQAGMDAAHRQAEAIRAQYGYSGGTDGSQYLPTGISRQAFSYESAPDYTSKYQSQIDQITSAILGREPFQYNYLEDPLYQQYAQAYTREGNRAMQDTLGQVSARTGGLASSYAASAASQANDYYMQQLSDKIPELQQLAYSMYQDEGNAMRANLDMLLALEQGDYGRYQDLLGQYNTDRGFRYGLYRDDISDRQYDQQWNYQTGRDAISDQRYADETAWNRQQYEDETSYARALEKAQTLAAAGDFSGYKALGYTDQEIAGLKAAYDRQAAAARSASSSSSSSGKPSLTYAQTLQAIEDGRVTPAVISAYDYYMGQGAYEAAWPEDGGDLTALNWDQDEGIFTWNGKYYSDLNQLLSEIDNAGLSEAQLEKLKERFDMFGFELY